MEWNEIADTVDQYQRAYYPGMTFRVSGGPEKKWDIHCFNPDHGQQSARYPVSRDTTRLQVIGTMAIAWADTLPEPALRNLILGD